jgi:hypothetical protein
MTRSSAARPAHTYLITRTRVSDVDGNGYLGVVLPQDGYLQEVREITKRHDIVLIFD